MKPPSGKAGPVADPGPWRPWRWLLAVALGLACWLGAYTLARGQQPAALPVPRAHQPLLDCLLVGDSIAVALGMVGLPQCRQCAKGGWNSWQVNRQLCPGQQAARVVVVSLGTNDHSGVDTLRELYALRGRVKAQRVVWVLPYYSGVNIGLLKAAVYAVANEHGDWIVSTAMRENARGIHPSRDGYLDLARQVREIADE